MDLCFWEDLHQRVLLHHLSIIWPPRQRIRLRVRLPGMVLNLKVKTLEFSHPLDLPWLQLLRLSEVLEVCMVCPDFDHLVHSNKVGPPFLWCPDYCQELLVVHVVVLLSCCEGL